MAKLCLPEVTFGIGESCCGEQGNLKASCIDEASGEYKNGMERCRWLENACSLVFQTHFAQTQITALPSIFWINFTVFVAAEVKDQCSEVMEPVTHLVIIYRIY